MAEAVKVAVRVRPFNSRQKSQGAQLCVQMSGKMTKVWNKATGYQKEFFFDYSYWSHDGFTQDPATGYLSKSSPSSPYADQKQVFSQLGVGVLNNAWQGYHCALFAYGQTGSGKSYSIVGYGNNKGIIPITCEEIFNRIHSQTNPLIKYDVKASMLEIYNEQIQDLLQDPNKRIKGGLKIRQHPKTGVYVQDLIKKPVGSYEQISAMLDEGNQHRTVAATQMNATSSRAHTVLTISFTQIFHQQGTGKPLNRKQSDINLVDLAGSQRASKTGATGDRLAEGSNINKSLSTLGKVITALAKKSENPRSKEIVPYRESKLTRILSNALGGNSKTTMIAAISPATFNIEETISTLRYADQVKAIKNAAVVNETPQERLIRELRQQNDKLKAMLEGKDVPGGAIDDDKRQEYEAIIEQLRREKQEAQKTQEQRVTQQTGLQSHTTTSKVQINVPHFQNLNEDPMLTGHIKLPIEEGVNTVGREESCNMTIRGLGIGPQHCQIVKQGATYKIVTGDPSLKTMVNGNSVQGEIVLQHQDRVRIGNSTLFVFIDPSISTIPDINYEDAIKQANENQLKSLMGQKEAELRAQQQELKRKMQQEMQAAQKQLQEEKRKIQEAVKQRTDEDAKAIAQREEALLQRQREMEEQLRKREQELKDREKQRQVNTRLEQLVSHSLQVSHQANERSEMLGKPLRFKPEFYNVPKPDGTMGVGKQSVNMRMRLVYPGLQDEKIYWGTNQLQQRIPDMAEMCQQYFEGTPVQEIDVGYDPFQIDPESLPEIIDKGGYIGMVNYPTAEAYNLLESEEAPHPIFHFTGPVGQLYIEAIPEIPGESLDEIQYESISEIIGRPFNLHFSIKRAEGIPVDYSENVHCKYVIPAVGREVFQTSKTSGSNPNFNYNHTHNFIVTKFNSSDLENGYINVNLFGSVPEAIKNQRINNARRILGAQAISLPKPAAKAPQPAVKAPQPAVKAPQPAAKAPQPAAPAKSTPAHQAAPSHQSHLSSQSAHSKPNFDASPSPLSISVIQEQKQGHSNTSSLAKPEEVKVSGNVETAEQRQIRELELKLKEAESTKKSGCCEVF